MNLKTRLLITMKAGLEQTSMWRSICGVVFVFACGATAVAGTIQVPNASFESPVVPPVAPYASPAIDEWQKSPQPSWYDPRMNSDTPWEYLSGEFYNIPFPGQYIENADGTQAAFLFAVPEVALFQDYESLSGTNTSPTHAFNARFTPGYAYELAVAVLGGGGGMKPGVTLRLELYYRDSQTNLVPIASTTVTNNTETFPTNTLFVDFKVTTPTVKTNDAWADKHIGVRLLSTADFQSAGGYWDLDNVRLVAIPHAPMMKLPSLRNGQFVFTIESAPGAALEVLRTSDLGTGSWASLGTVTNTSGTLSFTNAVSGDARGFYRLRQL